MLAADAMGFESCGGSRSSLWRGVRSMGKKDRRADLALNPIPWVGWEPMDRPSRGRLRPTRHTRSSGAENARYLEIELGVSSHPREGEGWRAQERLRRGQALQDNHRSAAAGTGPGREGSPLISSRWLLSPVRLLSRCEEAEAKRPENSAPPRGQKTEVPNAHEAGGEQGEEEAAQELLDRERHQARLIAVGVVSPAKGDLVVGQGDEAMVGDGDAMRVASAVAENLPGPPKGGLQ